MSQGFCWKNTYKRKNICAKTSRRSSLAAKNVSKTEERRKLKSVIHLNLPARPWKSYWIWSHSEILSSDRFIRVTHLFLLHPFITAFVVCVSLSVCLSGLKGKFISFCTFTCTVESSYSYSLIRTFNWTTVLVPLYKHWGRIDLLSDSAMVGGNMPRSAGCYWTLFQLVTQATNKLASG